MVQEKIDGSQFSFTFEGGQLECRSKGQKINLDDPGMFRPAVDAIKAMAEAGRLSTDAIVYQCEFLAKPKHNVLAYGRIPKNHLVLFDTYQKGSKYCPPAVVHSVAIYLGLEPVPILFEGTRHLFGIPSNSQLLEKESVLGGVKIEGYVIKNYGQEHPEAPGHPMTAKVVSPQFKERQQRGKPEKLPGEDPMAHLVNALTTEARYLKAIQHLKERGELSNDMSDIPKLMKEVGLDLHAEETDWLKEELFKQFSKPIFSQVQKGVVNFYKNILVEGASTFQQHQTNI